MLAPELGEHEVFVDAHSITTGRKHGRVFRGGWDSYGKLLRDLSRWMKQDQNPDAWYSTMVDMYRLPGDFPGLAASRSIADPIQRVLFLEEKFAADVVVQLADTPSHRRFIPYIQLHEFEALLFSDPAKFLDAFPEQHDAVNQLLEIRAQYDSPEHIDDGDTTAPSKRIETLIPAYSKTVSGLLIAKSIGLTIMRRECKHFDSWIGQAVDG